MQRRARIIGIGSYLPKRRLTNFDLEKIVDTSDEWIFSRTGIKERRIAEESECSSEMGAAAAKKAIEIAKIDLNKIDLVINATITPDYLFPSTGAIIQGILGLGEVPAFDCQAACTGFIYSLSIAKAFIESNTYSNILVIATEKISSIVDYTDRSTCVLFGDGACAAVVSNEGSGLEITGININSDGSLAELLKQPAGGSKMPATEESVKNKLHYLKMEGSEIFKHAVRRMEQSSIECIESSGFSKSDIDWFIPHQANARIIDFMAKRLNLSEDKIVKTLDKYGNTSASSVGIALDELHQQNKIKIGDKLLLTAFGAGLTWGATLLTRI